MLTYIANYVIYLLSGVFLLGVFFVVYTRTTPLDEVALVRAGNAAAALSLSGALIGFTLTIASGILHNSALLGFVAAEAAIVPVARELLLVRWGLAPESTITKGYWRIDPK